MPNEEPLYMINKIRKRKNVAIPVIICYIKRFLASYSNQWIVTCFLFVFVFMSVCIPLCSHASRLSVGSMTGVYIHSEVNLQCRRELQQHFQWDRWMKFIKHVTVNTLSREKTLQRINKCWLYQPPPPVIYTPESTFLLRMNYGNKWLLLLWSLWMPSSWYKEVL